MDRLEMVHQRNRMIMLVMWPLLLAGVALIAMFTPVYAISFASVCIPTLALVTVLIRRRKMVYGTMYIVVFGIIGATYLICYIDPVFSSYCMIYVALILVSLYQDIRTVILAGVLLAGMTDYFYVVYRDHMFPGSGIDDIAFFNIYIVFMVNLLASQIRFSDGFRRNIVKIINQIREFSIKLKDNVVATGQITGEVNASFQEIAASVESQAASLSDVRDSMNSTGDSVRTVVEDAASLSDLAGKTNVEVERGNRQVAVLMEQINNIHAVINMNSWMIEELGGKTRIINQILGKLDEIVERTDLLALNAAIESARAGEYGRGFAVVSGEVRKLSENSRLSMKEIAAILQDIRSKSGEIAEKFAEGSASVDSGKRAAENVGGVFRRVTGNTRTMLQKSGQVEVMVRDLEGSSGIISGEISSIAGISEGISESVMLLRAVIEDQSKKVNGIVEDFKELEVLTESC
ncbi:MAG: methyl-accepting chemotaxis protein [Bacillota bacterium]